MNFDLKETKEQASALRAALKSIERPAELSHAQCLDLIARMQGLSSWHALAQRQRSTYFYERHESYLPCSVKLARSLSVRRAQLADLATLGKVSATALAATTASIERFEWQVRAVQDGRLRVDPLLEQALQRSTAQHNAQLHDAVAAAERRLHDVLALTEQDAHVDACIPLRYTLAQARDYHAAYLDWRLATLACKLHLLGQAKPERRFTALARRGVDMYTYAAGLLVGWYEDITAETWMDLHQSLRTEHPQARPVAKALLLAPGQSEALLVGDLAETWGLSLSFDEVRAHRRTLSVHFPELAAWLAWVELKPLLAEDADTFHKQRCR